MLTNNNIDTAINLVRDATSLLGVDFIDSTFDLFVTEDDEGTRVYRTALLQAIEEVQNDLFDHKLNLYQDVVTIAKSSGEGGIFNYLLINKPIQRILKVLHNTIELKRTDDLLSLNQGNYLLQNLVLRTAFEYESLKIVYISNNIFAYTDDASNEFIRKNKLQNNGDLVILDKYLVIYKFCVNFAKYRQLPYDVFLADYVKRLTYMVEESYASMPKNKMY